MTWFYKQFYPNIDEDEAQYIYWNGWKYEAYPKLFLQKMIRFMIEKKLKNFDYDKFVNFVLGIINQPNTPVTIQKASSNSERRIYLFSVIPLLKIIYKKNRVFIKLFGFMPLLKIKMKG